MSVDIEKVLLEQLATFLDGQGVGTYDPAAVVTDTPIVFGELPTTPDRGVGLTVYDADDSITDAYTEYRVQAWCRGDAGSMIDGSTLAGSVFDVLHGLQNQQWGVLYLVQARRLSVAPMGIDDNRRQIRSDNYALQVNTPVTAGRPG